MGHTLGSALAAVRTRLAAAGIDEAALDARLLVAQALGVDMAQVVGHPERPLQGGEAERLEMLVERRRRREPLAYLLGRREFWSLDLRVSPATLIPRPESETLVEAALTWAKGRGGARRILDLGTGSGCLLLALLNELPEAWGVGTDISEAALAVARDNAERLGCRARAAFVRADWTEGLAGAFDLIIANPPYVASWEHATLPPEVREYEPEQALFAGEDGGAAYRRVLPALPALLAEDGAAFVEVGGASINAAVAAARHAGLAIEVASDLAGRPRCLRLIQGVPAMRKNFLGNHLVPV